LKLAAMLAGGGFFLLGVALYLALWDVPGVVIAKTLFPVVRYNGPKIPPTITWSRGRPAGWVSLAEVPRKVVGAILVSEDAAFYGHHGFDFGEIRKAIEIDFKARRFVRGASTITQQTARNLFLEKDKTLWRKLKEVVLTVSLERKLSKGRILELYLNIAEFGRGLYGIGPASRHYFHKSPSNLSAKEAAFLAMLLPSPIRYSLSYYQGKMTPKAERKVEKILGRMVKAGYLSEAEGDSSRHFPLPFERTIRLIEPEEREGVEVPSEDEL
jgi:monofunctional biosynthetic peptidoglycan transglycosylase